jgi:hypothetical protein
VDAIVSAFSSSGRYLGARRETVVDSNGQQARTNEDMTIQAVIADCFSPGSPVSAGSFYTLVELDPWATIGDTLAPGLGTATAAADVVVTSYTVQTSRTVPAGTCMAEPVA